MQYESAVICHLFYPDIAAELLEKLKYLDNGKTFFLFNIQGDSYGHKSLFEQIEKSFKNSIMMMLPEKGRDIGAKLLLIDLLMKLKIRSEYMLIIHDKKSPHVENGNYWREELFKIIAPNHLRKVFKVFNSRQDVGLICSSKFIQNEYDSSSHEFYSRCNRQLKELIHKYEIKTSDYSFVAGNIFWVRSSLYERFFTHRSILSIRSQLETGNVLDFTRGTYVHAWERIMSWVVTSQRYSIYGI